MRRFHPFIIAASSIVLLALVSTAWAARGGGRSQPARVAAPRAAPQVVVKRSSPPQPAQRRLGNTSPSAVQSQTGRLNQSRLTGMGNGHDRFSVDRSRHSADVVPGWGYGYYGSPYGDNYGWLDDETDAPYAADYATPNSTVAATPATPVVPNGPALFGQPPTLPQAPSGTSPDFAKVGADITQAEAELDAAEYRVRQTLADRPDYRAALNQKQGTEERVDALHASGETSYNRLFPAAQEALEARQQIVKIESAAMANDPQVAQARAELQAAAQARNELRAHGG